MKIDSLRRKASLVEGVLLGIYGVYLMDSRTEFMYSQGRAGAGLPRVQELCLASPLALLRCALARSRDQSVSSVCRKVLSVLKSWMYQV